MSEAAVHFVFNSPAEAELRRALKIAGRDDRVVGLVDCLSFGPINPPDPELRTKWVEDELGCTEWDEVIADSAAFWSEALSARDRKIAWFSRCVTQEFAGFLEWLFRLGDAPFEVVDMTDITIRGNDRDGPARPIRAVSLGFLSAEQIVENGLLDRAQTIAPALRKNYLERWRQLRAENAPFRVLSESGLVSAPLTFFDALLLSLATPEWRYGTWVVGHALGNFLDTSLLQTSDLVLASRVRALAEAGQLQARGDLTDVRKVRVRLPDGRRPD